MRLAVPPYDVERLDKAITTYTALGHDRALEAMRTSKLADFSPIHVGVRLTMSVRAG